MNENHDGQGKSLEEETVGAMRAVVIALGASMLFFGALIVALVLWLVG